ncbi:MULTISPECIES: RraA family protein [Pseudomonas]|uniref:Putative 4-hydroxy-4-methyl-2-oxoglutarate aldolase n=2 Tax=Pseudomonas TaxID=286 RepID=A0A7V8J2A5_PSEPU|nr:MULTISPECIES: RraA family protein [Pseudomonas]ELF6204287.1 RraA family protein [Pseudomonas putida]KAF0252182.1 RraA family protein [Pseudomonas putida]MDD1983691.1 RraA family protein [Pseudomonas asiatica]UUC21407.1 RraA family protein [Pseudomonas asiatica]
MKKFLIGDMPDPISPELEKILLEVETATVGHLRHWGFMDGEIQALGNSKRVVGTAVTLALPAQDSTLLHYATSLIKPGHIVVIDRLGDRKHACWGGGVTQAAVTAGASAAVIDGMCTDPHEIQEHDFPVWSRGVSPITTRIYGLGGKLNMPVSCGGVAVCPGDIVICDENGVLVLSPSEVDDVVQTALAKQVRGVENCRRIREGEKLGDLSGATAIVEADA